MKKQIALCLAFILLLACVFCFSSCSHIEDSNGESKELAVITDADIQSRSYGSVSTMSSSSSRGYKASGVTGGYKEKDNTYSRLTAKKFSGVQIANVCKGNGSDVTYIIESAVTAGNFKIVIMDDDNQIFHVVPIDEKATVTIPTEAGKLYFVTYAGESAQFKVELWRTMG